MEGLWEFGFLVDMTDEHMGSGIVGLGLLWKSSWKPLLVI